jgi:hypothetical protein
MNGLTKITQETIEQKGLPFDEALQDLLVLFQKMPLFTRMEMTGLS